MTFIDFDIILYATLQQRVVMTDLYLGVKITRPQAVARPE